MAIALFVKVRPYVARKMKVADDYFQSKDGNYLISQVEFQSFGPLHRLQEYAAMVGGVVMRDDVARDNLYGDLNTPLPQPTDPEWVDPDEQTGEWADEQMGDDDGLTGGRADGPMGDDDELTGGRADEPIGDQPSEPSEPEAPVEDEPTETDTAEGEEVADGE